MVKEFQKRRPIKLSQHFSSTDFDCKCSREECIKTFIDDKLVIALEELWEISGGFQIDSGFRCHAHNAEIGGAISSQHLKGTAADCKSTKNLSGSEMAALAEKTLFRTGGIGEYNTFAHCDVREEPERWKL